MNPHLYGPTETLIHMPWHTQRITVTESHLRAEQILMKFIGKEFNLLVIVVDLRLQEIKECILVIIRYEL